MINRNMFFVANWKMFGRPAYYKILEKVNKYIIRRKKKQRFKYHCLCAEHFAYTVFK